MIYRKLPRGGEEISIIGFGTSSVGASGEAEAQATIEMALESGVNYFDLASGDAVPFPALGRAMAGNREKVLFQLHFGADYKTGKYGWTTNLEEIKRSVGSMLDGLKTGYIDFGFLHCIDEQADFDLVCSNGVLDYIRELQKSGAVRHLGMSTHSPEMAQRAMDAGIPDMIMFSLNPGYDYCHGEYALGAVDERAELYRRCAAEGVGISVMKPFSGGQLLSAATSPFRQALTEYQCMQYALDKPGVLTVLPGVRNRQDLQRVLGFLDASPEERDYSIIGSFAPQEAAGVCVYCNHCQPCPAGLDVGLINKYYDLSRAGDALAKVHYDTLEKHAGDCVSCGHCDGRCPFHVAQSARMEEIRKYFGK